MSRPKKTLDQKPPYKTFALMEKLIAKNKSGDVEGFNATVNRFNDEIEAYNRLSAQINSALHQIASPH